LKILSTWGSKRHDYISFCTIHKISREQPEFNNTLLSNVNVQNWTCGSISFIHSFSLSLSLSLSLYIYIYTQFIYFFTFLPPLWGCSPKRTMASTFFRFVDSTQRHTANSLEVLWTSDQPIAETSTWQHTTLTTDKHQCPAVGFEPTIPARQRLQTQALDRTATGTGIYS